MMHNWANENNQCCMKNFRLVVLLVVAVGFVSASSFAQKTYLRYPFYHDDIRNVGKAHYYVNLLDCKDGLGSKPLLWHHGYCTGLVINYHCGYGFGLHFGIQYVEATLTMEEPFADNVSGIGLSSYFAPHMDFKLPFSNDFALGLHSGPGIGYGISGGVYVYDIVSLSYDVACYLEHRRFRLEASYSWGLLSIGLLTSTTVGPRNRMMFGIVWFKYD